MCIMYMYIYSGLMVVCVWHALFTGPCQLEHVCMYCTHYKHGDMVHRHYAHACTHTITIIEMTHYVYVHKEFMSYIKNNYYLH